jgi:hypothetical protein
MFAWFKRLIREYEVGQKMAQSFANDLDNLIARYKPISEGYLGLLQGRLNKCLNPTDGPPLLVGPIEYKLFVDNVGELRGRMTGEIMSRRQNFRRMLSPRKSVELSGASWRA